MLERLIKMMEISGILLISHFYFPYLIAISRDIKINQSSEDALPYQQLAATKIGSRSALGIYFPQVFFLDVKCYNYFFATCDDCVTCNADVMQGCDV